MGEILKASKLSKGFPGVKALTSVDFDLRQGEIHGLMGENGAGKSTLIKVITGFYKKDEGEILFDGKSVQFGNPMEAVLNGISTVYQEINLIPSLSVAENMFLGRQPMRPGPGGIDWRTLYRRAEEGMRQLDLDIDVRMPLDSYPVAIQQMVSIARALDISAKVLILDEPTSSLDKSETDRLFGVMRKLRDQGLGILFVSHFLDQVFEITDRITVLRNGLKVGVYETKKLTRLELISQMLGKDLKEFNADQWKRDPSSIGEEFLSVKAMSKAAYIEPFDLTLRRGEVLALAGLLGSGRTEIAKLLYGMEKADSGEIAVKGRRRDIRNPRQAIRSGMGFCSEDRKAFGIIPELSVRENIVLALQAKRGIFRFIGKKQREEIAARFIAALNIKTAGPDTAIKNLSGGNQQKVILARWLAANPELLILDEPTRGIDIGAKVEIQKLILDLKKKGLSILFISSELEEAARCADRVAVLRDRRVVGALAGDEIGVQAVMRTIAEG